MLTLMAEVIYLYRPIYIFVFVFLLSISEVLFEMNIHFFRSVLELYLKRVIAFLFSFLQVRKKLEQALKYGMETENTIEF